VKQALCGRADLLRVLVSECNETTSFITRSLGFEWIQEQKQESKLISQTLSSNTQASIASKALLEGLQKLPDMPFWRVEAFKFDELIEQADSPKLAKHQSRWVLTDEQTPPELSPSRNVIPSLRRELAVSAMAEHIDLGRTLKSLSRAEILVSLPRQQRRSWGREVQVIVDRSTAMTPYWQDQVNVCAALERFFPHDSIQYADYRQAYQEPIINGDKDSTYTLPGPGSLVIVLGDLGLLSTAFERAKWRQLGRRLQQNRCRGLALVPTENNLTHGGLTHYWRLIPWERRAGVSLAGSSPVENYIVERLLGLISPATRIERGFLRQVRRLIGAGAAAEAAVWSHPALIGKSSVAATFDPKQIHLFRARFEQESEVIRKAVLKLLLGWRTHLPREIWYEEIISLSPNSQSLLPKQDDLSQAYQFFHELGQGLVVGEIVPGFHHWFREVEQRLSASAWHNDAIKFALHRMWWSTHQGEPDAVPPADYEPRFGDPADNKPIRTFQLYQKTANLQLIEAEPSIGLIHEVNHGSWLGQIQSRNGDIVVAPVPQYEFWQSGQAPTWASDWGQDEYGLWVEFKLEYDRGVVTQRLRWISPGQFMMGSPESEVDRDDDEGPQHQVTLTQGYWLFDTAVTQALWLAVMGENPTDFKGENQPVENVSWDDCQQFIKKLNDLKPGLDLNLPTEAQWEYACRAGSQTAFNFGEQISPEQANYYDRENSNETVAVKAFQPNAWGLYQMHGNVEEWCLDGQRQYEDKSEKNPVGPLEKGASRVVRGGAWSGDARILRAAYRSAFVPGNRIDFLGLRCARVQESAQPLDPRRRRSGKRRPAADRSGVAARVVLSQDKAQAQLAWPHDEDFVIRSDLGELLLRQLHCPPWAKTIGRDRFGLWTEFELESEFGKVRQRLRWIPPGRFMMGSPESEHGGLAKDDDEREWFTIEGPQHLVTISQGYWLFDTPVTQALWQAVMEDNPSEFKSPKRPVENVSWQEANDFINKLNDNIPGLLLSLPTEAQWEYACRANTQTSTYYGELEIIGERNAPVLDDIAWYGGNSGVGFDLEEGYDSSDWPEKQYDHVKAGTREVALKKPNGWGLYDMLGNVWEWCMDGQRTYEDTAEVEPMGDLKEGASRVVRGGAWGDDARGLRAALRNANDPDVRYYFLGLRCARVQVDQEQGRQGTQPRHGQGSVAERRPDRGEAE